MDLDDLKNKVQKQTLIILDKTQTIKEHELMMKNNKESLNTKDKRLNELGPENE